MADAVEVDLEAAMEIFEQCKLIGITAFAMIGADFEAATVQAAPIRKHGGGGLRSSIQEHSQQVDDYTWLVGSNIEYAAPVHEGHIVLGPVFSTRQRRWWFWTLWNVYGGNYEPLVGVGNNTEGQPFLEWGWETVEPNLDQYVSDAIDALAL